MDLHVSPSIAATRTPRRPKDYRQRQSLPAPLSHGSRKEATKHLRLQPASPEVISSLISSLSAISTPAEHHFESLPNITTAASQPPSPFWVRPKGDVGPPKPTHAKTSGGFGMDYGAYNSPEGSPVSDFLHPSDAAIPPVIRTAKPPSGLSPISALKSGSRTDSSNKAFLDPRTQEQYSQSIGNLSIERGPRHSAANVIEVEGEGKGLVRKIKSYNSLKPQSSKERMRELDRGQQKRKTIGIFSGTEDAAEGTDSRRLHIGPSSPLSPKFREGSSPSSPVVPKRTSSVRNSTISPPDSPGGIGSGRTIPARDSSLRHSFGSNSDHRKSRSHRLETETAKDGERRNSEKENQSAQDFENLQGESEEDKVNRRIRQLKEQKWMRDSSFGLDGGQSPLERDSANPSSPNPVTPLKPSSDLTNISPIDVNSSQVKAIDRENSPNTYLTSPSAIQHHLDQENTSTTSLKASRSNGSLTPISTPLAELKQEKSGVQRHSSRMKRLSGATSPSSSDKDKRVNSNPLTQPTWNSVQDDRPTTADSIDEAIDDYLLLPKLSQRIRHPLSGRLISFSEVGDSTGSAVFCCVGMGLTRYITAFYDELALTLKLRLITLDRPGVGDSEAHAEGPDTPLSWPDDVRAVCQHLKIKKFSILAHSAGAIYALATALRMPQHIRGRVHLLAPWIPPSQMSVISGQQDPLPVSALPYSQRLLRSLPTPLLKAANSSFFNVTSASVTSSLPKSPRRTPRKSLNRATSTTDSSTLVNGSARDSVLPRQQDGSNMASRANAKSQDVESELGIPSPGNVRISEKERQTVYDTRLTQAIWNLATTNANPAVDLLVCLERRQTIGFRYADITRAVVIHHGSKDSRVPVENVKWLAKSMRRCEVRVLEGEGHGLMASAGVMGNTLVEISKEWEDWLRVVEGSEGRRRGR